MGRFKSVGSRQKAGISGRSASREKVLLPRGFWSKADLLALVGRRRHQLSNCRDGGSYGLIVCPNFSLQFSDLCGKFFVLQGGLAQFDEGANDKNTHPHRPSAIEHVGRHDGAMLSED